MPSRLAWTLVTLATLTVNLAFAVPTPWNNVKQDSYSGAAGKAPGGNVEDSTSNDGSLYELVGLPPLADVASQNAGNGGGASSGSAMVNRGSGRLHGPEKFPQINKEDSFTGVGGDAEGGNFGGKPGIINLLSANAANGGTADSGPSGVLDNVL